MSRQDKATTEKNARTLRELVKQTDNKSCADCRRNDARWASWNLGVFVCIRCSGIHRSMGTHISKVKSIDLDIWQPEQMESMKKWGNKRANLYWEKHLKAGHNPPDHKMESFIRSKYESRRWAMQGPPPADPSVLESGEGYEAAPPIPQETRPTPTTNRPTPTTTAAAPAPSQRHALLSSHPPPSKPAAAKPTIDLLSGDFGDPSSPAATPAPKAVPTPAPAPATQTAAPGAGLFDLDFRTPTAPAQQQQQQQGKQSRNDIMSLFASVPPPVAAVPAQNQYASWGGGGTDTTASSGGFGGGGGGFDAFGGMNGSSGGGFGYGGGQQQQQQQHPQQQQGLSGAMGGMSLGGMGGMGSQNVWGSSGVPSPPANPYTSNPFPSSTTNTSFSATSNNHYMSSQDVWGAPAPAAGAGAGGKADPFADMWK